MKSPLILSLASIALASAMPAAAQSWYDRGDTYGYNQDRGYDRAASYDQAIRQIQRGVQEGSLDRREAGDFYRRAQLARAHEVNALRYQNYDPREMSSRYANLIQQIRQARHSSRDVYDRGDYNRGGYDRGDYDRGGRGYYGDDSRY